MNEISLFSGIRRIEEIFLKNIRIFVVIQALERVESWDLKERFFG